MGRPSSPPAQLRPLRLPPALRSASLPLAERPGMNRGTESPSPCATAAARGPSSRARGHLPRPPDPKRQPLARAAPLPRRPSCLARPAQCPATPPGALSGDPQCPWCSVSPASLPLVFTPSTKVAAQAPGGGGCLTPLCVPSPGQGPAHRAKATTDGPEPQLWTEMGVQRGEPRLGGGENHSPHSREAGNVVKPAQGGS